MTRGRASLLWLLVALLSTAAAYWGSLSGEFVYDDKLLIVRNPGITDLANLPELLFRSYWGFLDPGQAAHIGYWRPLSAVAHALAWAAGNGSPGAFHVLCVLVHLGAVTAAFLLAREITASDWKAGLTALLFGLHPTHVESVAWISALNDPLFGLFALLSLGAFVRWRARGSIGRPIAAGIFFFVALLAKEMAVAVIPLLLALDLGTARPATAPEDRWYRLEKLKPAYTPFAAVFGFYYLVRVFVFESVFAGFDRVTTDFVVGAFRQGVLRLELIGGLLRLLAWPTDLALFRPFQPFFPGSAFADTEVLLAGLATVVFLAVLGFVAWRRMRPELFALLAIPAGFLPVLIRVESLGVFPLSDRFLYLPTFGFALFLCLAVGRLVPRTVAALALLLVGAGFAWKTVDRIVVWQKEEVLFRTSAAQAPRSPYVLWGLGRVLLERHLATKDPTYLEEAFAVYERAQELLVEAKQPRTDIMVSSGDYLQVNLGLGLCYVFEAEADEYGSYATPIAIFEQLAREVGELQDRAREVRALGISVREEYLELYQIYTALGTAQMLAGKQEEAEASIRKALTLNANYPEAHQTLGRLFARRGDWGAAIRSFEKAAELRPGNFEDHYMLLQALQTGGRTRDAEELAEDLIERFPEQAGPCVVMATIHLARNESQLALTWIDRALRLDPDLGFAWFQQAQAFMLLKSQPDAIVQAFRRATELMPGNLEANYGFAQYLLSTGALEAAIPYMIQAYGLASEARHLQPLYAELVRIAEYGALTPDLLFRLASIDQGRRQLDFAEVWLDQALALDPDHANALFLKGRLVYQRGRTDEAVALMKRAADLLPESFVMQSELGTLLVELERESEAIPYLERALELSPPANWHPDAARDAKARLRELLDRVRPPEDAIGPPAPREN